MGIGAKGAKVSNLVSLGQFVFDVLNCLFIIASDQQVVFVEQKQRDLVALKFVVEVSISFCEVRGIR